MSLKLRRGTDAQRIGITPAEGELIYTTDTKKLYVGDGSIPGGIAVDTGGSAITDIVQDTTPQLGGNLDINGHNIVSSGGDINILPVGGSINFPGTLEFDSSGHITKTGQINIAPTYLVSIGRDGGNDGNLYIVRNSYSSTFGQGLTFAQHHSTQDAVNINLYRTRGTSTALTAVQNGDDLADLNFIGQGSSGRSAAATLTVQVDGVVGTSVPGKFIFETRNQAGAIGPRAELSSEGIWRIDQLSSFTNTNITLLTGHSLTVGDVRLSQNGIATVNSNANLYISANSTGRVYLDNLAWPTGDGLNGQVLTTDGSGSLSWSTVSGGGSSFSRTTVVGSSSSLADGASENVDITGASKGYLLYKIQTNEPARVRIYTDQASRTADAARAEGFPATAGNGLIAEVITTTPNQIYILSPVVVGFNNESTPTTSIFLRITNKGGYSTPINTTLTILSIET
jgi:hypothetical protein